MNDPHLFDRSPQAAFAARLEAQFLRAAGGRGDDTGTDTDPRPSPVLSTQEQTMTVQLDEPTTGRTPRRSRLAWVGGIAAAVILIVALVAVVSGRNDRTTPGDTSIPVTFTVTWEYSDIRHECTPTNECLNHFDIPATSTFEGDVSGNGFQALYWNDPRDYPDQAVDHLEHVGTYQVQAEVAGCGVGDFLLVEFMQFVSGPDRDRDTGTYKGTWQIVPNSGRGFLSALSGSGTSDGLFATAGDVGRTFTGSVTCGTNG